MERIVYLAADLIEDMRQAEERAHIGVGSGELDERRINEHVDLLIKSVDEVKAVADFAARVFPKPDAANNGRLPDNIRDALMALLHEDAKAREEITS